jgi:hypothetical protein
MSFVIRLICAANGVSTPVDGQYVLEYHPTRMQRYGYYDESVLKTTGDMLEAKRFEDVAAAVKCYRLTHGLRPDGQPNRPLTAWSVEIARIPS